MFYAFVLTIFAFFKTQMFPFFYFNMSSKAQSLVQIVWGKPGGYQPLKMKGERRMFLNQERIREKINPTMKMLL